MNCAPALNMKRLSASSSAAPTKKSLGTLSVSSAFCFVEFWGGWWLWVGQSDGCLSVSSAFCEVCTLWGEGEAGWLVC